MPPAEEFLSASPTKEPSPVLRPITKLVPKFRMPQPKLSGLLRGDFSNVSERKLMDCLNRLGYDIEIKVKPAAKQVGHLMLAVA
jgi:hypothetical protein